MKNNIMKKFLSVMLVICFCMPFAFLLTACGEKEEPTVMNVELNPEVEFILNKDDKVVSVNALNDEGNVILSAKTFVDLSAEDAVKLFVEVANEKGYLLQGDVTSSENQITVSLSSDNGEKLYNSVKSTVDSYVSSLGVEVNMVKETLTKEYLEEKVSECFKELTGEELDKMTEEELVNLLKQSRDETKEMLSQELKDLYYDLRLDEIREAKYAKLQEIAQNGNVALQLVATQLNESVQALQSAVSEYKTEYIEKYLNPNSEYNQRLQELVSKKKELLQARLDNATDAEIEAIQTTLTSLETVLESAKTTAKLALDTLDSAVDTAFTALDAILAQVSSMLSEENLAQMENSAKTALNNFGTSFKTEFKSYLNSSAWASSNNA